MSIMEYLGRLKGITDQLGVDGYVVSDKEKVQQTLSGLGPDFYAFTTALEVLPILPTFNELQGKLLQHEMNMKQLMRGTNQEKTAPPELPKFKKNKPKKEKSQARTWEADGGLTLKDVMRVLMGLSSSQMLTTGASIERSPRWSSRYSELDHH
ncbi:hypothetical protein EJ110_NYTH26916 [Nymphaea thermarum]|nr:hypothetical protein EJ110_NYTH26916 [Nymphaea thermarum]